MIRISSKRRSLTNLGRAASSAARPIQRVSGLSAIPAIHAAVLLFLVEALTRLLLSGLPCIAPAGVLPLFRRAAALFVALLLLLAALIVLLVLLAIAGTGLIFEAPLLLALRSASIVPILRTILLILGHKLILFQSSAREWAAYHTCRQPPPFPPCATALTPINNKITHGSGPEAADEWTPVACRGGQDYSGLKLTQVKVSADAPSPPWGNLAARLPLLAAEGPCRRGGMPRGKKCGETDRRERGAVCIAAGYDARGLAKPTPFMSCGQPSTKRRAAAKRPILRGTASDDQGSDGWERPFPADERRSLASEPRAWGAGYSATRSDCYFAMTRILP